MTTDAVVEETRTEIAVEEVTETRYRCAVCEMVYEPSEIITVGLDRDRDDDSDSLFTDSTQPRAERYLCHHCADGLFEYDADSDRAFSEAATPSGTQLIDHIAAAGTVLLFVAIVAGGLAASVAMSGGQVPLVPAAIAGVVVGFGVGVWL